jgi:hypothetical protein
MRRLRSTTQRFLRGAGTALLAGAVAAPAAPQLLSVEPVQTGDTPSAVTAPTVRDGSRAESPPAGKTGLTEDPGAETTDSGATKAPSGR